MASKLTKWINAHLKAKGKSPKEAQKDAGKYSSIAAAKRAGSLYYTDKKGRVMIAAYAEDLNKPLPEPKLKKPEKKLKVAKKKTETVSNKEVEKAISKAKLKIRIAESEASVRSALAAVEEADRKLDIFNKTNVLNERAREFKKTKVASKKYLKRVEKEAKEKGKGPEITVVTVAKNMRRKTDPNPRRGYESGRDDLQSLPRYLQNIRSNPSARRNKK